MKQTAVQQLEIAFRQWQKDWDNYDIKRKNKPISFDKFIEPFLELEKQQQGYSEEEVIELLKKALTHKDDGETGSLVTAQGEIRPANFFSWFNKFKNK